MSQIVVQINPDVPPTGSDLGICNAARKSFGRRSEWEVSEEPTTDFTIEQGGNKPTYLKLKDKDKRLLEFLARGMTAGDFDEFRSELSGLAHYEYKHDGVTDLVEKLWEWRNTPTHASPFGHAFLSFELKIPIFLARQLVKHKFLRWSEYSRRYITDDVEFYKHTYRQSVEDKKQGSGGEHSDSDMWVERSSEHNQRQLKLYKDMIEGGVAPEQARGVLPADLMTSLTWSGSLDAFADMCRLRLGSDSQKEAQFVAQEVYKHLEQHFPVSARCLVHGC